MSTLNELLNKGVEFIDSLGVQEARESEGRMFVACIALPRDSGVNYSDVVVALDPQLDDDEREVIAQETKVRLERLFEHGPDVDAWQRRSDGGLQTWLTLRQLDPWLTDELGS